MISCKDVREPASGSQRTNAAFRWARELVITRSRDPGNHEFTTCQWNALLSD